MSSYSEETIRFASRFGKMNAATTGEVLKEGIKMYAWWKDGTQYVGSTGRTLSEAISAIDEAVKEIQDKGDLL